MTAMHGACIQQHMDVLTVQLAVGVHGGEHKQVWLAEWVLIQETVHVTVCTNQAGP